MSTTSTRRSASRYQLFENQGRERAAAAGEPLERLAIPAVFYPATASLDQDAAVPAHTLITRKAGRLYTSDLTDPKARPEVIDFDSLVTRFLPTRTKEIGSKWQVSVGGVIYTPDAATTNFLIRKASVAKSALGRGLELSRSLPASTRLVELPKALSTKFFMPTGNDGSDIDQWAGAFGLPKLTLLGKARTLASKLYVGTGGSQEPDLPLAKPESMSKITRDMATQESALLRYAGAGTLSSDCGRFDSVVSISARWEFLTQTDELGREHAMLDGSVFTLRPAGRGKFSVQGPFRTREGKRVVMLPAAGVESSIDRDNTMTVDSVSVDDDGNFTVAASHVGRGIRDHLSGGGTAAFVQEPFMPAFTGRAGVRWTTPAGEGGGVRPMWRDVPLHISLASAPREDAA